MPSLRHHPLVPARPSASAVMAALLVLPLVVACSGPADLSAEDAEAPSASSAATAPPEEAGDAREVPVEVEVPASWADYDVGEPQLVAADHATALEAPQPGDGDVVLAPDADWQQLIDAAPAGSTFRIPAGLHRQVHLVPRDGDTILGEPGAVVSGAALLDPSDFVSAEDGTWILGDRVEEPFRTESGELHGDMEDGFARDAANHDLWWDQERWQHVSSRDEVDQPGEWFFDYDADEVVVGADPATAETVELAVTERFADGDAADVTIAGLVVERYASPAQRGAIHIAGEDWHLIDVEVRESHGTGVIAWHGTTLDRVVIRDQGQVGIATTRGQRIVVRDSEIIGNGRLRYRWTWERGGLKFKESVDAVVVRTRVSGNDGPGIWFDLFNEGALIADNVAEANTVNGIFYEISDDAVITGNEVRDNGAGAGALGAGIFVSISTDVLVEGNTTSGHPGEVVIVHADRTDEFGEGVDTEDVVVTRNTITISSEAGVGFYADTDEEEYYMSKGITFADNTYLLDGCEPCFRWGEPVDLDGWLATGNDTASRITTVS